MAAVEHDRAIDPALTAALEQSRERVQVGRHACMYVSNESGIADDGVIDVFIFSKTQVLKWEDQILQFMRAGSKQLDFPPLSSYHRLIIHRLAQRFGLDHTAIDPGSSGHYLDPNANRYVRTHARVCV